MTQLRYGILGIEIESTETILRTYLGGALRHGTSMKLQPARGGYLKQAAVLMHSFTKHLLNHVGRIRNQSSMLVLT